MAKIGVGGGVVYENIESAELFLHLLHQIGPGFGLTYVTSNGRGFTPRLSNARRHFFA